MPINLIRSKIREVFTYNEDPKSTHHHRFTVTIETDGSVNPEPSAAVFGAADLLLRLETLAHHVAGGEAEVLSLGDGQTPGQAVLKLEASARSEDGIHYLSEHVFDEARRVAEGRHLLITVERKAEERHPHAEEGAVIEPEITRRSYGHRVTR